MFQFSLSHIWFVFCIWFIIIFSFVRFLNIVSMTKILFIAINITLNLLNDVDMCCWLINVIKDNEYIILKYENKFIFFMTNCSMICNKIMDFRTFCCIKKMQYFILTASLKREFRLCLKNWSYFVFQCAEKLMQNINLIFYRFAWQIKICLRISRFSRNLKMKWIQPNWTLFIFTNSFSTKWLIKYCW